MSRFVDVPTYFSHIYLVDLSPSLCDIARRRFKQLGWSNVTVLCQDARNFCLQYCQESSSNPATTPPLTPSYGHFEEHGLSWDGADLVTMSYSLSMIVSRHEPCRDQVSPPFRVLIKGGEIARLFLRHRLDRFPALPSWHLRSGRLLCPE